MGLVDGEVVVGMAELRRQVRAHSIRGISQPVLTMRWGVLEVVSPRSATRISVTVSFAAPLRTTHSGVSIGGI